MKSISLWIAALTVMAAVTSGGTPYSTPIIEKPAVGDAGAFDGLLGLAETLPPSSSLTVLWTHGMCTHPPSWVDDRLRRLVKAIGGTPQTINVRPVGGHGAMLRTERISTSGRAIEVKFLSWSPLTAAYKTALINERPAVDGGSVSYDRATLNQELKIGLVNDCLTDVVVYGGVNGRAIRQAMNEAVCDALGGRSDGQNCNVPPGNSPAALALVTESLGSKLVFDAILDVWTAAENGMDGEAFDRVATSLAATRTMFMLSNQMPLLDSAGPAASDANWESTAAPPKKDSSAKDVFGLLSRARRLSAPVTGPMTVVAFSDPNDLLSYRITAAHLAEHFRDFRVVNVIVSNDTTYFGYVERPDTAHCGYAWNSHVYGMLARGYQAGKAFPSVSDLMGGSCINSMGVKSSGLGQWFRFF